MVAAHSKVVEQVVARDDRSAQLSSFDLNDVAGDEVDSAAARRKNDAHLNIFRKAC